MSAPVVPSTVEPERPSLGTLARALPLIFTATTVLRFTYKYFDDVARGMSGTFLQRAIEEATGNYASMLLAAAVVFAAWRWPIDRPGWRRRVPIHLVLVVAYSLVHTTLMWGSRLVLFPLAGLGAYDYGFMVPRYLMEFGQDVISYATFLGVLTAYRHWQRLRLRELSAARLERSLAQAQLANLRLQLQPHFLFNALNTISSTMYEDARAADQMMGRLAELLRVSLRTSHAQEVALGDELEALGHYLALLEARFGNRLKLRHEIQPGTVDAQVPSLILQPLVENAVRHGNLGRLGHGTIVVRARLEPTGRLALEVWDDGPGIVPAGVATGDGLGLRATAERLRLLYGALGSLETTTTSDGFLVRVVAPLRYASRGSADSTGRASEVGGEAAPEPVAFVR